MVKQLFFYTITGKSNSGQVLKDFIIGFGRPLIGL